MSFAVDIPQRYVYTDGVTINGKGTKTSPLVAVAPSAASITQDATHRFVTDTEKSNWNIAYSNTHTHSNLTALGNVSGVNTGDQDLNGKEDISNKVTSLSESSTDMQYPSAKLVYDELVEKQPLLVSGTNIKTVNSNSILGSGDIIITGGSGLTYSQTLSMVSLRV